jgi:putative addiction module component (TIGR02574 family)
MSIAFTEIEAQIRALSRDDKADLVKSLIAELDGPPDAEVQREWLEEAQRRHREVVEGKVQPVPANRVFANLRDRLKQ